MYGQKSCQAYYEHIEQSKTHTGETPFQLAYRSEAVIPTEVELTSYRVRNHDERKKDEAMRLQLYLLDEVKTTAEQRLT